MVRIPSTCANHYVRFIVCISAYTVSPSCSRQRRVEVREDEGVFTFAFAVEVGINWEFLTFAKLMFWT